MRKPSFLSAPSCVTDAFMYCSAMLSVIWKQMRAGTCAPFASWVLSHSMKPASTTLSFDRRTNRQPGLLCAANDSDAPTTQRSMFLSRSLRSAAAMNSAGSTSLPW